MKNIRKIALCCFLFFWIGGNSLFSQLRWDSVGKKISGSSEFIPETMYADNNYLYAAGQFDFVYNKHIQGIARWNGAQWDSMGAGIDGLQHLTGNFYPDPTVAITSYQNKLYVGGLFTSLGKVPALYIGSWDGTKWDTMPIRPFTKNFYTFVAALAVINNKLYVGGAFDTVAGFPCIGIACWDGTNWSSLNFPNLIHFSEITSICEYNGSIYVAGSFAQDSIHFISSWDGKSWNAIGGGVIGKNDWINTIAVYNGELYAAGYFFKSDGNVGNCIQKWNGTKWSDVGGGTDYEIFNLLVYNNKLYAMGELSMAGGIAASSIACWDGSKWCSLGSNFDNNILTACSYKDSLYIGGGFWTIDGDSLPYVAEWTGGDYTANCSPAGVSNIKEESENVEVYPNPSNGVFTLIDNGKLKMENEQNIIEVYNMLGEKVYSQLSTLHSQFSIDLSNQPNGIYLYRVISETGNLVGEGKLVVQR